MLFTPGREFPPRDGTTSPNSMGEAANPVSSYVLTYGGNTVQSNVTYPDATYPSTSDIRQWGVLSIFDSLTYKTRSAFDHTYPVSTGRVHIHGSHDLVGSTM